MIPKNLKKKKNSRCNLAGPRPRQKHGTICRCEAQIVVTMLQH